ILVVEDQAALRTLARMWLEFEGYEVVLASDGVEGLQRFVESKPDLIVTDMDMPYMNSIELSRAVRATSDVPILLWSSNPIPTELTLDSRPIIDGYVFKSGDSKDLVGPITKLLPVNELVSV
ncbi:MAG: response regulator, partial [SAR202 cluster bacterium]|nr:response regulator [SAR202 cluster bacterium]